MFTPCIYQGYMFKNLAFVNIWTGKPPAKVNLHGVNSKSARPSSARSPKKTVYIQKTLVTVITVVTAPESPVVIGFVGNRTQIFTWLPLVAPYAHQRITPALHGLAVLVLYLLHGAGDLIPLVFLFGCSD